MSDKSEWNKLRKRLIEAGLRVEGGGDKHYKIFRDKELLTALPSTPGGGRGLRNKKAELKRKGVTV